MFDSKCHQCRRAGEKLFLKGDRCISPKCAVSRRDAPPGMHGGGKGKRRKTKSEYGIQLQEKQKVKRSYGMREKQFRNYFEIAEKSKNPTTDVLGVLLETRLDNVVFRFGFAGSRSQARQMVNHGHFMVNGRRVDIPSYRIKEGDAVYIREGSATKKIFQNLPVILKKYNTPMWLELDKKSMKGEVRRMPTVRELDLPFKMQLITEFYSK